MHKPTDPYDSILWIVLLLALLTLCAFVFLLRAQQAEAAPGPEDILIDTISGIAGWYGPGFYWKPMKNGEPYNAAALTFAMNQGHPDGRDYLLIWTGEVITPDGWVDFGKTGIVRAQWTDTGGFTDRYGRIADLSVATMRKLTGGVGLYYGLIKVKIYPCADLHMERR